MQSIRGHDMNPITAPNSELGWRYDAPADTSSKILLLQKEGCAVVGTWGRGLGWMAWCPLPKRDIVLEKRLGLRE